MKRRNEGPPAHTISASRPQVAQRDEPVMSNCFFLGRKVEGKDGATRCTKVITESDYCHGCEKYVCDNHTRDAGSLGPHHAPEAHLVQPTD
jgi:hypothetical protein